VNSAKLKWIAPLSIFLIILIGVLAWWIIQERIAAKAEAKFEQALREFDMDGKVKWKDLSVSPSGTLTLNQVRVELGEYGFVLGYSVLGIDQVRISDVINLPDHQRIHIQLKHAEPLFEGDPEELEAWKSTWMMTNILNPADVNLKLDLNFASNQAEIIYDSQQDGFCDIDFKLTLSEIAALRGALAMVFPKSSAALMELDPNVMGLNRIAAIDAISLNSFEGSFKNRGLVEQIGGELKQQMEVVRENPASGNIEQAREEAFLEFVQEAQAECHQEAQALKQPCQIFADIMLSKRGRLQLTAKPAQPVSFEQFDSAMNEPEPLAPLFKLLNINIQ